MMKRRWDPDAESPPVVACAVLEPHHGLKSRAYTAPAPRPAGAIDTDAPPVWVVVLAGGEGRRVQAYTTMRDGVAVPKQFCRFRDDRTLVAATIDRALSRSHTRRSARGPS